MKERKLLSQRLNFLWRGLMSGSRFPGFRQNAIGRKGAIRYIFVFLKKSHLIFRMELN